jgi:hypothetical protein
MELGGERLKTHAPKGVTPRGAALLGVILAVCLAGVPAGCASGSGPEDAYKQLTRVDYSKPYIGMSKAEVLKCAGQPRARLPASGGAETLIYNYSGAGPVPSGGGDKKSSNPFSKKKKKGDTECTASLVFENERLIRVSYAHKEGRSPYQWQSEKDPKKAEEMRTAPLPTCVFSLPRCPR